MTTSQEITLNFPPLNLFLEASEHPLRLKTIHHCFQLFLFFAFHQLKSPQLKQIKESPPFTHLIHNRLRPRHLPFHTAPSLILPFINFQTFPPHGNSHPQRPPASLNSLRSLCDPFFFIFTPYFDLPPPFMFFPSLYKAFIYNDNLMFCMLNESLE